MELIFFLVCFHLHMNDLSVSSRALLQLDEDAELIEQKKILEAAGLG